MTDLSGGQQSGARSLAALFKRDYKWPNPEASSGKKIGNMGRQQCYEAVGPAREEFDILAREISEFLENCTESVSANVSWSLYMFGKSRESSRPQIAFCSPEREARRSVRKSVTRSGILERHPGFSTMDCSRPPEFVSPIVSLAEDGMELELTGSNLSYTIFVQPRSSSAIGADLSVLTNGGSIQDRRTATAGGILVWDERHFLMTAGHIFGNDTRSTFSTSNTNDDLEFDFDEIDDSEGDEALSTSRGSMTSTSTTSDSLDIKASSSSTGSQEMQTATPSTSSTRNEIKTLKIPKVPKELWGEGNRVGHRHRPLNDTTKGEDASNEMESLKEVTFKELDLKKEMPCQADLMEENSDEAQSTQLHNDSGPFQGPFISSSDGSHSSLDYALIEITGSNLAKRNSLVVNDESASREVLIQGVARNGCSASDVLVVTSRGIMRGQMSGTPTYLQPAYSTNQQELWTVSLYGELEKGDCGAWVIDAKTGLLYGHLIAGTLASGSAYIVPLWQVFDDLHQLLGGQWWLAGEIPQHHNQPRVFSEEIFDGKSSQPNDKREVLLHDLASTTTSVSKQQPMQPRVIENFLQFLDRPENRFLGIRGKGLEIEHPFIPSRILELELAKPMGLKSLIQATFPEESEFALRLALIRECYLKVFCILLKLGRGSDIQILMGDNSYSDVDLPFDFHQLPDSRKGFLPDDLIEPFHQQQWAFCAPKFQHKTDSSFKSEQILPITAVEKLGDGGSAVVYKIKIHEAYDELIGNRGKGFRQRHKNTYVLKRYYTSDAKKYYLNEIAAFEMLKDSKDAERAIINYHGSFRLDGTFNILLEYADGGTLEDAFQTTDPPVTTAQETVFWRGMLNICRAIKAVHKPVDKRYAHTRGWHQDVKPSNILLFTKYASTPNEHYFKLADFGNSHFKHDKDLDKDLLDDDSYGTRTYGAPECYHPHGSDPKSRPQITQKIDIWSLGCVFSEAAVWIMGGKTALTEFRQLRKEKVSKIRIGDHDCFHDGRMALPLIRTYTKNLYSVTRDHLTQTVLDTLLGKMLSSADKRLGAEKVYKDLQQMIWQHPTLLPNNTKASPETSAVQNKKPLPSKTSIGQSTKPDLSVAGSSTHPVYKDDTALMNTDSSLEYGAYSWDSVPAYKLPQDSLEMYLRRKFGNFRFYTRLDNDSFKFWIPRLLTQTERMEIMELRHSYVMDGDTGQLYV